MLQPLTPYDRGRLQAVENVISGERYRQFTDEAIKYILGYYGEPVGPVDQNVKDKAMSFRGPKSLSTGNQRTT